MQALAATISHCLQIIALPVRESWGENWLRPLAGVWGQ
jgi:hypothetical protein